MKKIVKEGYDRFPTLNPSLNSLRPHLGTTVSQKKRLTWGKVGVYTCFVGPARYHLPGFVQHPEVGVWPTDLVPT
jgi:hypothetical protein